MTVMKGLSNEKTSDFFSNICISWRCSVRAKTLADLSKLILKLIFSSIITSVSVSEDDTMII
jgi:hypothetical protein